ncbi:MAG: glutathione S-transferase family protein [Candidatus Eremiobacteraeota bacterium]|nr:glutathione S-transferase family protein [Candidatus Eremiobacteraeota bacterium]MBV8654671.1 glutathione S-transferase family protein [Candidatus Eremiobacteraeota bacterium]
MSAVTVKAQFPGEQSADGAFVRQDDAFRQWVTADGRSGFAAEPGRYHLYVSLACPWAHRTIIVRKLKALERVVGMTIVDPVRDERGWRFSAEDPDPLNRWTFLSEAYEAAEPGYRGRVTVPVLWDARTKTLVSNSDDDIMRMFETEFDAFGNAGLDLYPAALASDIDALNALLYERVNNGVYRAGFSTTQSAYEAAVYPLFETLDAMDERLSVRRYVFGDNPVETDWRFFVTLVRFDAVYVGHFKCNLRRIADYPNLSGYVRDLYQIGGVGSTVNFDHIKRHYYFTHDDINPTRIVPVGPLQDLGAPHGRERLSQIGLGNSQ